MTVTDTVNNVITCQNSMAVTASGTSSNCSFTTSSQGLVTTFVAQNVSPNTLVQWSFGDGIVGGGYQITHPYATPGTYTVCMDALDTNGIQCTSCQQVTVTAGSGNCYFNSFPDSLNQNTYYFGAVPAYPNSSIVWDYGDGTTDIGSFTTHVFPIAGTYTVCMTELDSMGATLCTSCQVITISNVPSCSFTSSVSILNPLAINFQDNGGNSAVTWDFGDGSTGSGASAGHTYAIPGIYFVCMYIGTPGTSNFCSYCDVITAGVQTNYCNITYYPDPLQPFTIVFSNTGSSPSSTLVWDFGDNTIGTGQTVTHTYNAPGFYNVCLMERDSLQNILCQSCISIQVGGGGGGTVCQSSFVATSFGLDGYFIDLSITTNPLTQYLWDFGDGSTSNVQFPSHTYATTGLYNVCLTISDSSCSDMFCSPVLIDTGFANPGNGCNAFYAFVQLAPYQVTVVNLSSGLNLSFDWDFGDGSPHDTNPYPSHVYSSTGSYNLCLTVSDANGCSSSYCDTLNVDTLGNIYRMASPGFVLNVLSPAMLTGVNEVVSENSFGVYPNPFNSELHISMLNSSKKAENYRILSVQGAEVLRGKLEGSNGTISTQTLSSGVYLLEVTLNDGSRSFQKVMKN